MKATMTILALGLVLVPFAAKANCNYATSQTEMVAAIAKAEALVHSQVPWSELGLIEILKFNNQVDASGDISAYANIRFDIAGSQGTVVTVEVKQNCQGAITID